MNIIISGSTGLVGRNLCQLLQSKGHRVVQLVRGKSKDSSSISWNPETGEGNLADFEGFDAVVHLAGENIAKGFWTSAKKKRILESRQKGTENLVVLLKKLKNPPKVFISASALGTMEAQKSRLQRSLLRDPVFYPRCVKLGNLP